MVDVRTYPLWREFACRDNLPAVALPVVIEALTTPVARHVNVRGNAENWRAKALEMALPSLLNRTGERDLRARLIAASDRKQIVQLVVDGILTSEDVPAIVAAHQVWPDLVAGLARHERQVPAAVDLACHLTGDYLVSVVHAWEMDNNRLRLRDSPPTVPIPLFTAVLELSLQPLVDFLAHPETIPDWAFRTGLTMGWSTNFNGPGWHMLERCPDQWSQLVEDPSYGRAVQHILLDHADTQALSDGLLAACLPSLTCPELAHLPQPTATERQRLHHIAQRVERHPRLKEMAADQLRAAADDCVKRGRLLQINQMKKRSEHQAAWLACDLALTCGTPRHLAKICGFLAQLPQPFVVTGPPLTAAFARWTAEEGQQPRFLLGRDGDYRVKALTQLVSNVHTPNDALVDALARLHPVEIAWLQQHADLPDWYRQAVTTHAPTTQDDGVVRILTDEELDAHPNPGNVLQSWLDASDPHRLGTSSDIERAILSSRHRTEALLRQLPADAVLTRDTSEDAAPLLISLCGDQPTQWTALLTALERIDNTVTFGEFLDSLSSDETLTTT